jgi:hypothetical protein
MSPSALAAGEAASLPALLDGLGFSSGTIDRIERTRALDGTQEAESDGVTATWTYHPDAGLSLILGLR